MTCSNCGNVDSAAGEFCSRCGNARTTPTPPIPLWVAGSSIVSGMFIGFAGWGVFWLLMVSFNQNVHTSSSQNGFVARFGMLALFTVLTLALGGGLFALYQPGVRTRIPPWLFLAVNTAAIVMLGGLAICDLSILVVTIAAHPH